MTNEIAPLTLDSLVSRSQEIMAAEMGLETVMLDVRQGAYFGLDDIGSAIWKLLENSTAVRDLCTALQKRFNVEEDECRRDTLEFLRNLQEKGLLNVQPSGQAG